MTTFTLDAPVRVLNYTARIDGDDAVIGDEKRGTYITVPADGLDLLDALAEGLTVREAVSRFEAAHDYSPDVDDFLEALAAEGFVALEGATPATADGRAPAEVRRRRAWNLDNLSPAAAGRMLSRPFWMVGGAIILAGAALTLNDPGVLPTAAALQVDNTLYLWVIYLLGLLAVLLHEMGHVVGARAAGTTASLQIGNQMFTIVAETDISGIWLASKRQRYAALLAGPFLDLIAVGALMIFIWLDRHAVLPLPGVLKIILPAFMLTYFFRLVWQVSVYLRTDLYYVVTTALGVPSLMADTRAYLRNIGRRVLGRRLIDQSGLGPKEKRAVRLFSVLWIGGRMSQVFILLNFSLPILTFYVVRIAKFFMGESPETGAFAAFDVLSVSLFIITIEGAGFILWFNQLARARRERLRAPDKVYVE